MSALAAVATLLFGMYTWWESKRDAKPAAAINQPAGDIAAGKTDSASTVAKAETTPGRVNGKIEPVDRDVSKTGRKSKLAAADRSTSKARSEAVSKIQRLDLSNGATFFVHSNLVFQEKHVEVRTGIIAIPSAQAVARPTFDKLVELAENEHKADPSLIVVTRFRSSQQDATDGEVKKRAWHRPEEWEFGNDATRSKPFSSFLVIDEIIGEIAGSGRFPNVTRVLILGIGPGAHFASRYAAMGRPRIPVTSGVTKMALEFVSVGSLNYLYIDRKRPIPGADSFQLPRADCTDFNDYPYGLERRERFRYFEHVAEHEIRANLFSRKVTFVIGDSDTQADPLNTDASCAAMIQGENSSRRARNYERYVQRFPEWVDNVRFVYLRDRKRLSAADLPAPELRAILFDSDGSWATKR
jgi:hypothetical protein